MLRQTVRQDSANVLLSGLGLRVLGISARGAVFLGAYELAKEFLLMLKGSVKHVKTNLRSQIYTHRR